MKELLYDHTHQIQRYASSVRDLDVCNGDAHYAWPVAYVVRVAMMRHHARNHLNCTNCNGTHTSNDKSWPMFLNERERPFFLEKQKMYLESKPRMMNQSYSFVLCLSREIDTGTRTHSSPHLQQHKVSLCIMVYIQFLRLRISVSLP
jgi:hypothetical protein